MMNRNVLSLMIGLGLCAACAAQSLPAKWDELTGPDFVKAVQQARGVCVLPMGGIEKNGPSQPLGTALFVGRIVTMEAVKQEYAVVFPEYFVTATNGESFLPGAIAYSARLQHDMLEETVNEMARNGCRKIVIVNASSANNSLLQYFLGTQMNKPKDYVVYTVFGGPPRMSPPTPQTLKMPAAMQPANPNGDGHGGEERTAMIMAYRPELAHPERAHDEPIVPEGSLRLNLPQGVQVGGAGIKTSPTGYLGDASGATAARGKAMVEYQAKIVAEAIKAIKADEESLQMQKQFFERRANPLK